MFIQANFLLLNLSKTISSAVIFSFSHSSRRVFSINSWVSGNLLLTASKTAKAILSRFLSILTTRACSLIFNYSALCSKKYVKLFYTDSWYMIHDTWYMILNMVIERWLIFKISKYGYETLWLVFKIFKHCCRALWAPARCIKYPYKLFIALFANTKRILENLCVNPKSHWRPL